MKNWHTVTYYEGNSYSLLMVVALIKQSSLQSNALMGTSDLRKQTSKWLLHNTERSTFFIFLTVILCATFQVLC